MSKVWCDVRMDDGSMFIVAVDNVGDFLEQVANAGDQDFIGLDNLISMVSVQKMFPGQDTLIVYVRAGDIAVVMPRTDNPLAQAQALMKQEKTAPEPAEATTPTTKAQREALLMSGQPMTTEQLLKLLN